MGPAWLDWTEKVQITLRKEDYLCNNDSIINMKKCRGDVIIREN